MRKIPSRIVTQINELHDLPRQLDRLGQELRRIELSHGVKIRKLTKRSDHEGWDVCMLLGNAKKPVCTHCPTHRRRSLVSRILHRLFRRVDSCE
ncbi:MAG TPA: hypothetical protein DG761_09375 [Gammaproteobacteria bacterium]|nr:hypothetical protein [Gammaproteobacteria bacterium]|tara:strand:- start:967 stop:1248 length:282 start_codon:yes stop_codon:yes gene_type:complete